MMLLAGIEGRNAALKAGLIAGGIFGVLLVGSVYMCWHLGYIQALMSNEESGGQQRQQQGEGKGGEEKEHQQGTLDVDRSDREAAPAAAASQLKCGCATRV